MKGRFLNVFKSTIVASFDALTSLFRLLRDLMFMDWNIYIYIHVFLYTINKLHREKNRIQQISTKYYSPNPGGSQRTCVIIPTSTYEAFRVLKSHKSSRSRIIDRTSIGISVFHLETNLFRSVRCIYHSCCRFTFDSNIRTSQAGSSEWTSRWYLKTTTIKD
jgi:hypothetical protein